MASTKSSLVRGLMLAVMAAGLVNGSTVTLTMGPPSD